ncbi:type III-B CRISPR module-associated protein Cmr5 [bacterium]|nr:type III-B CRISPR module-associated protein Cmr5 [bacterium]
MRTRDQDYAARAFQNVTDLQKTPLNVDIKRYGSLAHRLPVLIRTAGLTQALAFMEARGGNEGKKLLEHLQKTLQSPEALLTQAYKAALPEYMHLTQLVLAALLWYKRFAQSVLDVDASDESDKEPA